MNTPVLKDMQEMVQILRSKGEVSDPYVWNVNVGYAMAVRAELHSVGRDIDAIMSGDDVSLEFSDKTRVVMLVH